LKSLRPVSPGNFGEDKNASPGFAARPESKEEYSQMKNKNIGSSFDSWLREEGIYEETSAAAIKRVIARQIETAMLSGGISKSEMARRMQTSRTALNRLLDPTNASITLATLHKAASVIGREIRLELI
jgi:antitoxin HicB